MKSPLLNTLAARPSLAAKVDSKKFPKHLTAQNYSNFALYQSKPIEVGNLIECVVVDLRDAGRVVVFQFQELQRNEHKSIKPAIGYNAMHWSQILPLRERTLV